MYNKAYHIGGTEEETYRVHANDFASHLFPTLEQPTHQRGVYVCVGNVLHAANRILLPV